MRVKVKNFECGKSYDIGFGAFNRIFFSRKKYVLWYSYDYINKQSVSKKFSKTVFKEYMKTRTKRSIVEIPNEEFFYDYFKMEERQQEEYCDESDDWSNDYACENYCCSCCGCSCYDYYDEDFYKEDEDEEQ